MTVTIQVMPFDDDKDVSFQSIQLTHVECQAGSITKYRNPTSDDYTLRCSCGLEVVLFGDSCAMECVKKVAIGAQSASLEPGSYCCNREVVTVFVTT
ncbi:hypothetical protein RGU72_10865 [Undibacterium sp. 5I1]|uniref:hypothetical protein n=1 Tax=unclassified Undibacterium TaxID=2630295 RepID=UPI002AB5128A|nr:MULTISPECIES: hypothetical protein [unclassified Undibacterium]MDY7538758.1 hypothetical protein [Undibacterium sp. 5I1]MEB0229697.1 hypothetical protein [Undibacterium sp. 10I3]MEB0258438.1 hypothetical protein [Undibacterium sp. 5I1]